MECVFGFTGKDYVLIAGDTSAARSLVVFKTDEDRLEEIDDYNVMGTTGPQGDRANFTEYIKRNIHLYALRNGVELSTHGLANFARNELAYALRKNPWQVNCLIAGYERKEKEPALYFMDHLACLHPMKVAAHGYGGYFILSTMDRYWRPDMTVEEGLALVKRCVEEIKGRLVINLANFTLKIVDKDGTRVVPMPELDVKPVAGSGGKPDVISSSTSANSSSPAAAMSVE